MIENPLVSIVCPVYNEEKEIKNMLDSVLNQDYKNIQLIIVDDASSDSTRQIIENRMKTDSRIVLLRNEKNEGPGPSKNKAIKVSEGIYLSFIDGDDWIEKDALSLMMKRQSETGADIIVCGYYQDFLDKEYNIKYSVTVLPQKIKDASSVADGFIQLDSNKTFSFCCNKLYRTDVIKKNKIFFPPIMYSEDFFFNIRVVPFISSFAVVEKPLYHYTKPLSNTLTTSDYIPDFYQLINKRYEASRDFCKLQNSLKGNTLHILSEIHIKHLSMCLIYNCSEKSLMNHKMRIEFAKKMLKDRNTIEVLNSSKPHNAVSRIMTIPFKTRNPNVLVGYGRILWFCKKKMCFLFNKTK